MFSFDSSFRQAIRKQFVTYRILLLVQNDLPTRTIDPITTTGANRFTVISASFSLTVAIRNNWGGFSKVKSKASATSSSR